MSIEILNPNQTQEIINRLNQNQVAVLPTDTIYGIHCKALNQPLVNRIYEIKQRPENMPLITAVSDKKDLELFDVEVGDFEKEQIQKFWPGPNTLIFKTKSGETKSFRLPDNEFLISILKETGPLISTSSNISGKPSARNIQEAINYFEEKIDFYVDSGELNNPPSNVYDLTKGELIKLR